MASRQELETKASEAMVVFTTELAKYDGENAPRPTDGQVGELSRLKAEALTAQSELRTFADIDAMRIEAEAMQAFAKAPANKPPHGASERVNPPQRPQTMGQKLASDPTFNAWKASTFGPSGRLSDSARIGNSPVMNVGNLLTPNAALITGASSTSAGALFMNDEYPAYTSLGRRPLRVRDIVTNGTTDSDNVEFARATSETNAAAPVAEATATSGSSGVKPESSMVFERVTAPVITIAHWMPATKAAIADAGQLRTLVDEFLRYGLEEELEDQIVNGSGSGGNFTGIFNTTGTQTQAWSTDIFETTRKALTLMGTVARDEPNAWVMLPATLEFLDLQQDNEARYYNGGPFGAFARTLWGVPVIQSEALPTGYALLGNFRRAVIWDRQDATIQVSDSHSDFFIRNLVAILAEMRAAFGVLKPNSFVEVDVVA